MHRSSCQSTIAIYDRCKPITADARLSDSHPVLISLVMLLGPIARNPPQRGAESTLRTADSTLLSDTSMPQAGSPAASDTMIAVPRYAQWRPLLAKAAVNGPGHQRSTLILSNNGTGAGPIANCPITRCERIACWHGNGSAGWAADRLLSGAGVSKPAFTRCVGGPLRDSPHHVAGKRRCPRTRSRVDVFLCFFVNRHR